MLVVDDEFVVADRAAQARFYRATASPEHQRGEADAGACTRAEQQVGKQHLGVRGADLGLRCRGDRAKLTRGRTDRVVQGTGVLERFVRAQQACIDRQLGPGHRGHARVCGVDEGQHVVHRRQIQFAQRRRAQHDIAVARFEHGRAATAGHENQRRGDNAMATRRDEVGCHRRLRPLQPTQCGRANDRAILDATDVLQVARVEAEVAQEFDLRIGTEGISRACECLEGVIRLVDHRIALLGELGRIDAESFLGDRRHFVPAEPAGSERAEDDGQQQNQSVRCASLSSPSACCRFLQTGQPVRSRHLSMSLGSTIAKVTLAWRARGPVRASPSQPAPARTRRNSVRCAAPGVTGTRASVVNSRWPFASRRWARRL